MMLDYNTKEKLKRLIQFYMTSGESKASLLHYIAATNGMMQVCFHLRLLQKNKEKKNYEWISALCVKYRVNTDQFLIDIAQIAAIFAPEELNSGQMYAILGLKPGATQEEIKKQYRALCRIYHPDASSREEKTNIDNFIQIKKAYEYLLKHQGEVFSFSTTPANNTEIYQYVDPNFTASKKKNPGKKNIYGYLFFGVILTGTSFFASYVYKQYVMLRNISLQSEREIILSSSAKKTTQNNFTIDSNQIKKDKLEKKLTLSSIEAEKITAQSDHSSSSNHLSDKKISSSSSLIQDNQTSKFEENIEASHPNAAAQKDESFFSSPPKQTYVEKKNISGYISEINSLSLDVKKKIINFITSLKNQFFVLQNQEKKSDLTQIKQEDNYFLPNKTTGNSNKIYSDTLLAKQNIEKHNINPTKEIASNAQTEISIQREEEIKQKSLEISKIQNKNELEINNSLSTVQNTSINSAPNQEIASNQNKVSDSANHIIEEKKQTIEQVNYFLKKYAESYGKKNMEELYRFFSPSTRNEKRPLDKVFSDYQKLVQSAKTLDLRIIPTRHRLDKDHIFVHSHFFLNVQSYDGKILKNNGLMSFVLKNEQNSFRIKQLDYHYNGINALSGQEEKNTTVNDNQLATASIALKNINTEQKTIPNTQKAIPHPKQQADQEKQTIEQVDRFLQRYAQAYAKKNLGEFSNFFSPTAQERGKAMDKVIPSYQKLFQTTELLNLQIHPTEHRMEKEHIYVRSRFVLNLRYPDGRAIEGYGTMNFAVQNKDGSFHITQLDYDYEGARE